MSDEITQQTLLPGVKDPNLWMVKCLPGTEKQTVIRIMDKYIAYQRKGDPLQIRQDTDLPLKDPRKKTPISLTGLSCPPSTSRATCTSRRSSRRM